MKRVGKRAKQRERERKNAEESFKMDEELKKRKYNDEKFADVLEKTIFIPDVELNCRHDYQFLGEFDF